jgi:glucose 1-dehydrogenase
VVENYEKACESYDAEATGRMIPAGFTAEPEDIAALVWFLSSDEARFIVGQTIVADGGTSSLLAFTDSFRKPLTDRFGTGYVTRS